MIEKDENFLKLLKDLENLGASGIKLELESEYLPEEKCLEISKILDKNLLNLVLKLGGLSSLNDIRIAKNINADVILAPMVESVYALEKFAKTLLCVYTEAEISKKKIYINVETKTGMDNFESFLASPFIKYITGIVIGRSDFAASLNMSCDTVDSDEIFKMVYSVVERAYNFGLKVILGGKITSASIPFLKKFPKEYLYGFETRKVFFPSSVLQKDDVPFAINKAIEFEIYYLQNFSRCFSKNTSNIDDRISALKKRAEF